MVCSEDFCWMLRRAYRYQRGTEEGQTTQWPKEKGQKEKQHNGQKKKDKRTNNDLQNIHITLKIE